MKSRPLALLLSLMALTVGLGSSPAQAAEAATKQKAKRAAHAHVSKAKRVSTSNPSKAKAARRARHAAAAPAAVASHDPVLRSASVVVQDQTSGEVLFEKNSDAVLPIASITKLMTAMVVLDAKQSLGEELTVSEEDVDTLRGSRSRLAVGTRLSREDMLRLALMSSENRASSALSRNYPGGRTAFVAAMNRKAAAIGLSGTSFSDPTGLSAANVSSAKDLVLMVEAAARYPLIREFTTTAEYSVALKGRTREFHNTNALVRSPDWEIGVSKTGFINEAGRCLVMQAWFADKPVIIVLLDSWGKLTRIGDANRIKQWMEAVAVAGRKPG